MAQPPAPKILAIGSPNSSLKKLVNKITAFQTNYGPFECCVIIGNLFKKDEDGSCLTPDLKFPIPTYFTHPTHPLHPSLSLKLNPTSTNSGSGSGSGSTNNVNNPEITPNLIYLGKCGVVRTSAGVKVGFVGGSSRSALSAEGVGAEGEGEGEGETGRTLEKEELRTILSSSGFEPYTLPPQSTKPSNNHGSSSNSISIPFDQVNINPTTSGPSSSSSSAPKGQTLAEARAEMKKQQAEAGVSSVTKGLDIIIFAEGCGKVLKCLPDLNAGAAVTGAQAESEVDEFVGRSRPRYVFLPTPPTSTSTGSGYAEAVPFGWTGQGGGKEERWTRVVRLDRFADDLSEGAGAGVKAEKGEKKKFFYAFTLPDLNASAGTARPESVAPNPFVSPRGTKRGGPGGGYEGDEKRSRTGEGGHVPNGYVCRICNQPGHLIQNCPQKTEMKERKPPPPEYVCHRCKTGGHWIQDCPEQPTVKKEIKMLTMDECWFCLANTNCDTRFIAAVQNDTYVALSKGQLIKTGDARNPPLVPGGAHLLIIPIQHVPNPLLLPEEEAQPLVDEIDQIKDQIRSTFAKFDAVPVFCDMYRNLARAQHGQIQAIPVPKLRAGELEGMFRNAAKKEGWEFEQGDGASLLRAAKGREFIKLDLPDGKSLVHFIQGKFNLQFARSNLANFLGTPDRANWQVCVTSDEQVKRDVNAFKKAFTSA